MTSQLLDVTIEEGRLHGKTAKNYLDGEYLSFLGIPYAKPPVGDLRFKAPLPAEPWEGIKDATKEGPECPSRHMFFTYHVGTEDNCLNLNVYTKELPKEGSSPKAVMVWIHGGAFLYGSNKSEFFGPDYLMSEDIVLVSINYRLGVFGFLSLEDPALGIPGNAGLKDMVLALKWVQRNISKFNGDPSNVTIFGESAGAASVHYLYLSPLTKGLFHKVIAQSGSALNCWAQGCHNGTILADALGFKDNDEKKLLQHLKTLSAQKIVSAQHKIPDTCIASAIRPFGPVVERPSPTSFLTEEPISLLKSGNFNQVPIIMGYTSKEGLLFEGVRKTQPQAKITSDFETEIHYELNLSPGCDRSKEIARKIEKYYFGEEKPTERNIDKLYLLKTDNQFVHGIYRCISYQKMHSSKPIYMYRMTVDTSINYYKNICFSKSVHILFLCFFLSCKSGDTIGKNLFLKLANSLPCDRSRGTGVCHADDLGYLFKSFYSKRIQPNSVEDTSLKRFVKMWTNFARSGKPTPVQNDALLNVDWKPVTKGENNYLDIGQELKMGVNADHDRMQFWDSIYS